MIYIDRSRLPVPAALDPTRNPSLQKERAEAEKFFGNPEKSRGQRRFNFKIFLNREVKQALKSLFHDKCSYCEVHLDRVNPQQKYGLTGDIEHFRPKTSVLEAPNHSGYWWLASEWDNMLIACPNCNRGNRRSGGKANRFPLVNEKNRVYKPSQNLAREQPLLLNPCVDSPEEHLVFSNDGSVYSETERGKATILVLGLNREDTIYDRLEVIKRIDRLANQLENKIKGIRKSKSRIQDLISNDAETTSLIDQLKAMTEEVQEYAGLKRQFIRAHLERLGIMAVDAPKSLKAQSIRVSKKQQTQVKKAYQDYAKNIEGISLSSEGVRKKTYLMVNHYIDKIELKNIKTFRFQVFDLTTSQESTAPWMMFLGENGAGKSTILKSISLNLSDATYFQKLIDKNLVNPNRFIRHGCKIGVIKIWLGGMSNPRILELRRDEYTFISPSGEKTVLRTGQSPAVKETNAWTAQTFLLGYGATRLLPRADKGEEESIDSSYVRVDNLFNPFVPLGNAEKWLFSLDATLFRRAALIFKDLLNMGDNENIIKQKGRIIVNLNGSKMPFDEMSDGYQSVVALTADVLQLAMTEWKNPDEARGVVMLDEVGAHLHPQWKMRIVGSLRRALPHMQFIVSSHQPLCLRGLGAGEVTILRRDENKKVEVLTDLPNPKELRISQILTSVFGLQSTLDPELEAEYKRYYELRAKHSLNDEQSVELRFLENQLRPDLMMGDTLLDAQTYKVVKEQYEQYKKSDNQSDLDSLSDNTISAVQSLWTS